jgi:IS30 family transposase
MATGGRIPRPAPPLSGRYLSLDERLRIADLRLSGEGVRDIAGQLGRSPGTISRELARNCPARSRKGPEKYAPYAAQKQAEFRGRRPKRSKFDNVELAQFVEGKLVVRWSPEQISDGLADLYPDRAEMQVSHETIYQALFVQGRGHLRADLHKQLRTGRAVRRPRKESGPKRPSKIPNMIMISDRPAEANDRAVPGHWEGDLILGSNCRSAIGTLVERSTRYVMLLHLPDNHGAEAVRDGLVTTIGTLPEHLRRSLTWDQGTELAKHQQITMATGLDIYFCDPHSPWQRGSNENTNGLLRQYFPKGTDLSVHTAEQLVAVAAELNARPRKTLGRATPAEAMQRLLFDPNNPVVATTT